MRNFQEKRGFKAIMRSKPVLMLLGAVVLIFAWSVIKLAGRAEETAQNAKIAENKIAGLQKDEERLSSDIQKLRTDEGKEEAIRRKFGLAKAGEGMIIVVEDKNQPEIQDKEKDIGFLYFLKNLFK